MGWALATHGPRGYFYALVTQLPISDPGPAFDCEYVLKLLSGLCLVDSEAKKVCSTQVETNHRHLYAHCTQCYMYMYCALYHSALAQVLSTSCIYHSAC